MSEAKRESFDIGIKVVKLMEDCIDSHQHVTAYGTSSEWLGEHPIGKTITEHYVIED